MSDSVQSIGERLMAEAERILRRDVASALNEGDYNLVVRRAQEVVELTLKGGLKALGAEYPKVHDVGSVFAEQARQKRGQESGDRLNRIEEVSLWLAQARAPALYLDREYGADDARRAWADATFVVEATRAILHPG